MSAPKTAAKADATGETISFDYDGETYTILPAMEWPAAALEAHDEGRFTIAVRAVLGVDQYRRLMSKPRKIRDVIEVWNLCEQTAGGDEGK